MMAATATLNQQCSGTCDRERAVDQQTNDIPTMYQVEQCTPFSTSSLHATHVQPSVLDKDDKEWNLAG
jgi:hypothetical protein